MPDSRTEDFNELDPDAHDDSPRPEAARPAGSGPYRDAREVLLAKRHRLGVRHRASPGT